ncbi:hypothetical protein L0U85_00775 [Glycomyces sp. L485]|uniref:hypothetical protein n=1 Tax=Glycomyces sp. L485 TaxID=2909235 RepID=UPI001F4B4A9D|nr:hypothetical protein [Glycomyces sp. L485]MCH7229403.1 hypothetical protein [Glycomyces sp. L485]
MATIEYSRFSRRTALTGAAAVLAAGITAAPPRAGAAGPASVIRSAAARGAERLALTADGDPSDAYEIRHFTVDADRRVALGERLAIDLPAGFHPHSMAARGETLWITGAVDEFVKTVTVDNRFDALPERLRDLADPDDADPYLPDGIVDIDVYRARPALLRVQDSRPAFVELPTPEQMGSGAAMAIALLGNDDIAIAIEGCSDPDLAVISRSHLAVSVDDGRTWRYQSAAVGLGEGYGTVLASVGDRILAVTADGDGTQTLHVGRPGIGFERAAAQTGAGRPMAAIPTAEGSVSVYSDRDGKVSEARFTAEGRALESAGAACGCAGEVLAVQGLADAWLEADGDETRAQGME